MHQQKLTTLRVPAGVEDGQLLRSEMEVSECKKNLLKLKHITTLIFFQVCGAPFACGLHICEKVCHAGPCGDGECPLQVRSCPCGKNVCDIFIYKFIFIYDYLIL